MVRLGFFAVAMSLAACSGEIQSDNLEGKSPTEQVAQEKWVDKALPVFAMKCFMCHDGSMPMIGYIAGADDLARRDTLVNYMPRIVNLGAPQSSRVLTKGLHTGPALEAKEASDILSWIVAESAARPPVAPTRTMQTPTMLCTTGAPGSATCPINAIDLSSVGLAGATFEVVVSALSDSAYLTNMQFKPGADGIYLEHPLLESWPAGAMMPTPDPIDRYFAVMLNVAAVAPLGTGEATMQGWSPADPISIRFDVIEKKRP